MKIQVMQAQLSVIVSVQNCCLSDAALFVFVLAAELFSDTDNEEDYMPPIMT